MTDVRWIILSPRTLFEIMTVRGNGQIGPVVSAGAEEFATERRPPLPPQCTQPGWACCLKAKSVAAASLASDLTHPIHERLPLNQRERVDIATSTFPSISVIWHTRFWKAAEEGYS
jgi:hypothetical protein